MIDSGDDVNGDGGFDLPPLVLASASPRRADILRAVGWEFVVRAADVDESVVDGERAADYVERLARSKATAVRRLMGTAADTREDTAARFVLGADTTVVIDDRVLGKPRDERDACDMLARLQDRWHEVLTGIALVGIGEAGGASPRVEVAHERTRVRFGRMTVGEIERYVSTGEPADKAGAYAVQGGAALFIERIEGDFWNVVGLPVRLVYELAQKF